MEDMAITYLDILIERTRARIETARELERPELIPVLVDHLNMLEEYRWRASINYQGGMVH